jgi:hypothetical protein
VLVACVLVLAARATFAQAQAKYLYNLASFGGPLEYAGVRVTVDQETSEVYVIYQDQIRIYSPTGMEVFSFGEDLDLGQVLDLAVDATGDIFILSFRDSRSLVTRCNFRGVPVAPLEITNLPDGLVFGANRMMRAKDLFYFSSPSGVIITGLDGTYKSHVNLSSLLEGEEGRRDDVDAFGFTVDGERNLYFTVPTMFRVFRYAPDGTVTSFGRPGSSPGRFGIVSGITTDGQGNLLITDKLRCVVMVFDPDFNFLTEFGYRGSEPDNLIVPDDIDVDERRNRVYVSQMRLRGVSVFALVLQ